MAINSWREISLNVGMRAEDCTKMWRKLRDRFVRARKFMRNSSGDAGGKKVPAFYLFLSWLGPHIKHRATSSKINKQTNDFQLSLLHLLFWRGIALQHAQSLGNHKPKRVPCVSYVLTVLRLKPTIKRPLQPQTDAPTNSSPMFSALFFPLAAEHKWPSVICAALMNRSTSSAKSKTRGHGRHHRWFVNRQGVWASRQQGHAVEAAGGMEGGTDQCGGSVSRGVREADRREATLSFHNCKNTRFAKWWKRCGRPQPLHFCVLCHGLRQVHFLTK